MYEDLGFTCEPLVSPGEAGCSRERDQSGCIHHGAHRKAMAERMIVSGASTRRAATPTYLRGPDTNCTGWVRTFPEVDRPALEPLCFKVVFRSMHRR
jgi:hypothetical protein